MTEKIPEQPKRIIVDEEGNFDLPEEQQVVWDDITKEIEAYYLKLSQDLIAKEEFAEDRKKIATFEHELESADLKPKEYILWHRLIGSGFQDEEMLFDTPDKKIEKFIKDLYKIE
ncbi:MAG: hypothetical protein WC229_02360 [Candidatus Paceibacterota bacterium]|jgi:hypothetical protein